MKDRKEDFKEYFWIQFDGTAKRISFERYKELKFMGNCFLLMVQRIYIGKSIGEISSIYITKGNTESLFIDRQKLESFFNVINHLLGKGLK